MNHFNEAARLQLYTLQPCLHHSSASTLSTRPAARPPARPPTAPAPRAITNVQYPKQRSQRLRPVARAPAPLLLRPRARQVAGCVLRLGPQQCWRQAGRAQAGGALQGNEGKALGGGGAEVAGRGQAALEAVGAVGGKHGGEGGRVRQREAAHVGHAVGEGRCGEARAGGQAGVSAR